MIKILWEGRIKAVAPLGAARKLTHPATRRGRRVSVRPLSTYTKNVGIVGSLGADEVIDYQQEDFTRNGNTYDIVFDAVGKHSFPRCRGSLKPGGTYIETDLGFMWHVPFLAVLTRWIGSKRVMLPIPKYGKENVLFMKQLLEPGSYRPVIDRTYPLEDVVEATRYVETQQKTGNVVLTLDQGRAPREPSSFGAAKETGGASRPAAAGRKPTA
jgi:D-arabinose 1-dehydrogenase-like Zn-dependent alcohol dehydrogenase